MHWHGTCKRDNWASWRLPCVCCCPLKHRQGAREQMWEMHGYVGLLTAHCSHRLRFRHNLRCVWTVACAAERMRMVGQARM